MQSKLELMRTILTMRRYAAIAAAGTVMLYTMYHFTTMELLPLHFGVVAEISPLYLAASIGLAAAISSLGGINLAMIAYKFKRMRLEGSMRSNSTIFGGLFAAFTPGCPACTAPLAVILGTVGGLSIFPMGGLELKLVSAGVLTFSIYWIARGLQKRDCCRII